MKVLGRILKQQFVPEASAVLIPLLNLISPHYHLPSQLTLTSLSSSFSTYPHATIIFLQMKVLGRILKQQFVPEASAVLILLQDESPSFLMM
jgi:hypothetical protein